MPARHLSCATPWMGIWVDSEARPRAVTTPSTQNVRQSRDLSSTGPDLQTPKPYASTQTGSPSMEHDISSGMVGVVVVALAPLVSSCWLSWPLVVLETSLLARLGSVTIFALPTSLVGDSEFASDFEHSFA